MFNLMKLIKYSIITFNENDKIKKFELVNQFNIYILRQYI